MESYFEASLSAEEASDGEVLVTAVYKNTSERSLYLCRGAPPISVRDAQGNEVDFIGPMVKRGKLTVDDFDLVLPAETRVRTRKIRGLYDFDSHGPGSFAISIPGGYYDPVLEQHHEGKEIITHFDLK